MAFSNVNSMISRLEEESVRSQEENYQINEESAEESEDEHLRTYLYLYREMKTHRKCEEMIYSIFSNRCSSSRSSTSSL